MPVREETDGPQTIHVFDALKSARFEMKFEGYDTALADLLPKSDAPQRYELRFPQPDGVPPLRGIVASPEDMQRLAGYQWILMRWERLMNGEWTFVNEDIFKLMRRIKPR